MIFEDEVNKMNLLPDGDVKQLLKIEAAKYALNLRELSKLIPCSWSYLYKCLDNDYKFTSAMKLRFIVFLVRQKMKQTGES